MHLQLLYLIHSIAVVTAEGVRLSYIVRNELDYSTIKQAIQNPCCQPSAKRILEI
jgi:hypothetical protein